MNSKELQSLIPPEHLLWIKKAFKQTNGLKVVDHKKLFIELKNKLPRNFTPQQIDSRLYISNLPNKHHARLKLAGIYLVSPRNKILKKVNDVIIYIKKCISNSNKNQFIASEVASNLNLDEKEATKIFAYIQDIGSFWSSAQGSQDTFGFVSIKVDSEDSFVQYLHFKSIYKYLNKYLEDILKQDDTRQKLIPLNNYSNDNIESPFINVVFIMMHMDNDIAENEKIKEAIKEVCERFGLNAKRADEIEHQDKITDVVLEYIRRSEYLIADLTNGRPNVYYEVGYAHAFNKKPILFRKKGTKIHFDLLVHNVPDYKDIDDFKKKLTNRIMAILGRKPK